MKNLFILLFLAAGLSAWSQVAINTDGTIPDPSAMLDVQSTSRGMLVPRMTTSQRTSIASPASGLLVFDNNTQSFWFYSSGSWLELTDQSSQQWTPNGSNISYTAGNVGIGDESPAATLTVGNGDKFQVSGARGDVIFTDDEASIQFPATTYPNSPMIYMFGSGTMNADRMVIGHSPSFPTWGIEYHDASDVVYFRNSTSRVAGFKLNGGVGLGLSAENPNNSAILDVSSSTQGFLPPRMTTAQRDAIVAPSEGLVVYNTELKALDVYNGTAWTSMVPVAGFNCGRPLTVNHSVSGGVAPVNKTVTYSTVYNIQGEHTKCWLAQNLGADWQASSVNDDTEPSAGWYWQFNRQQGYKHDGTTRTPNTAWENPVNEISDWLNINDPCVLEIGSGWRLPTYSEWNNLDNAGGWTNWDGPWNSGLKLHASGFLYWLDGSLANRGGLGGYWSSTEISTSTGGLLNFNSSGSSLGGSLKAYGFAVRCVRDN